MPERAKPAPVFDPIAYFTGHVRSNGVIRQWFGRRTVFATDLMGRPTTDGLTLTQRFVYDDGRHATRVWHLRRLPPDRIVGTADDVVGPAEGTLRGNELHWRYVLALHPGHPLYDVRIDQRMWLAEDGSMRTEVAIGKLGVWVAGVHEQFAKDPIP